MRAQQAAKLAAVSCADGIDRQHAKTVTGTAVWTVEHSKVRAAYRERQEVIRLTPLSTAGLPRPLASAEHRKGLCTFSHLGL